MTDKPDKEAEPETLKHTPLTPGEIAAAVDAAARLKAQLTGTTENIGNDRSGLLSPSHTPGIKP